MSVLCHQPLLITFILVKCLVILILQIKWTANTDVK